METQSAAIASTFPALINYIISVIQMLIPILVAAAIVIYFYHASEGVFKGGSNAEARQKLKQNLFWGCIILFVMISVWGLVSLLENSLFR
jgi:hypothetical protein